MFNSARTQAGLQSNASTNFIIDSGYFAFAPSQPSYDLLLQTATAAAAEVMPDHVHQELAVVTCQS
jgi:hypothetical protein